ncbi:MAG: hypothetical protein JNN11_03625 [Candidatus Doudnabacteria bacterium]|nr:hypothetical protein [Candidatus Doudnabacteria bacterium]
MKIAIVGLSLDAEKKLWSEIFSAFRGVECVFAHNHTGDWSSFFWNTVQVVVCEGVDPGLNVADALALDINQARALYFAYETVGEHVRGVCAVTGLDALITSLLWIIEQQNIHPSVKVASAS